jgi:hypothetical protein
MWRLVVRAILEGRRQLVSQLANHIHVAVPLMRSRVAISTSRF